MKKKKILATMIAVVFICLSIAGCGNSAAQETEVNQGTKQETVAQENSEVDITEESTEAANDSSEEETAAPNDTQNKSNVLVACFSATGNTKPVAEYAAEALGADFYEIVPADPYTDEDLNYNDSSTRVTKEQNDPSARPEISGAVENMDQYDTVIIAYPIWWGEEPKIIDTFIESYDFSGKTMTTLCTSGGSGVEASASNLQAAVSDVNWLESRRFQAGTEKAEVEQWLHEIGLL